MQTVKPRARYIGGGWWFVYHPDMAAHGIGLTLNGAVRRWHRKVLRWQTEPVLK